MSKKQQNCPVDAAGITTVDYKDTAFLKQFLTKFNRIVPRQYSGTSLKNQKKIATAVKRARYMALLPYVVDPRHNTFAPTESALKNMKTHTPETSKKEETK